MGDGLFFVMSSNKGGGGRELKEMLPMLMMMV